MLGILVPSLVMMMGMMVLIDSYDNPPTFKPTPSHQQLTLTHQEDWEGWGTSPSYRDSRGMDRSRLTLYDVDKVPFMMRIIA